MVFTKYGENERNLRADQVNSNGDLDDHIRKYDLSFKNRLKLNGHFLVNMNICN